MRTPTAIDTTENAVCTHKFNETVKEHIERITRSQYTSGRDNGGMIFKIVLEMSRR
jgi:hypothetical protein